jgi:hypothetical protein
MKGNDELRRVSRAILFETSIVVHQPRHFDLAKALGEEGWLKALRPTDYAPPSMPRPPEFLQEVQFPYPDAITLPLDRGA